MAIEVLQDNKTNIAKSRVVVSNQEIVSRKWRYDSIFKLLAGIIYGFFFGMLPATYNIGIKRDPSNPDIVELTSIIGMFALGIFSLIIIFWLFRGDIKKKYTTSYVVTHFINAILLCAGIIVATLLYPNYNDSNRYFIFAASYAGWGLFMSIYLLSLFSVYRKQFPLSWARVPFAVISLFLMSLIEGALFLSYIDLGLASSAGTEDLLFQALALLLLVVSICVFGFGIAFIKRYRDVLLGERTDNEIDTIQDWESARVSSIIIASVIVLTYAASLIWTNIGVFSDWTSRLLSTPVYIEIAIDALLLIPYIVIISSIRFHNFKKSKKGFNVAKIFKSIDNGLMLDVFAWIILVKGTLLQGMLLSNTSILGTSNVDQKSLLLILSFGTLMLLYGFSVLIQANVPNLRNTTISLWTILFNLVLVLFAIIFAGYLQSSSIISTYMHLLFGLFALIGMSISLIIKISMVSRIFKSRAATNQAFDRNYLIVEEENQKNTFINNFQNENNDYDQLNEDVEFTNNNSNTKEMNNTQLEFNYENKANSESVVK